MGNLQWIAVLLLSALVICVGGSLLAMYTWASTQADAHGSRGTREEALPLKGRHLATALAPILYMWSLSAIGIGMLLAAIGAYPLVEAARGHLSQWPAVYRLAVAVSVSSTGFYAGLTCFRTSQKGVTALVNQARQEQRIGWQAFGSLARKTCSLWCGIAMMTFAVLLTHRVSQVYP